MGSLDPEEVGLSGSSPALGAQLDQRVTRAPPEALTQRVLCPWPTPGGLQACLRLPAFDRVTCV